MLGGSKSDYTGSSGEFGTSEESSRIIVKWKKLAPKVVGAWKRREKNCDVYGFPTANGNRCARPTLSSGSTGSLRRVKTQGSLLVRKLELLSG